MKQVGKASRRKATRRNREPDVYSDAWSRIEARQLEQLRQRYGKAATLALMYGAGPMSMSAGGGQQRRREHPLEGFAAFKLKEKSDKRFGHTAVYKADTKVMGQIMAGEHVPETDVWVRSLGQISGAIGTAHDVMLISWCRRNKVSDIQHAVAWLLMQDKVPVVVRAFEP